MNKRVVAIVIGVVVLVVAGYFIWNWYSQSSSAQAGALTGSGTIETDQIAITPQTSGRIVAAPAEEGTPVKAKEVLYRLDPAVAKLQVDQAKAGVRAAKANYVHVRDDSGSSSADRAAAKAQWDQANVALKMALVQVGYTVIRSPIDGVLTNIAALTGENAVPGGTLAMVSNPGSLTVTIYIPENQIGQVKIGQVGAITTDSTTKSYHGGVVFIGTQAEFTPASIETKDQRVKLVYQVKLSVTDPDSDLKPGMPADVTLQ